MRLSASNTSFLRLSARLSNLLTRDRGQTVVEYALILVLLALGVATFMKGCSSQIKFAMSAITSNLTKTY